MKYFLALTGFITFFAPPASANDNIEAHLKYFTVNGQKVFASQWFDQSNTGIANFVLVWDKFGEDQKFGFILDVVKDRTFVSPKLPADCQIKSLKGSLNWMERGTSSVGITVTGASCKSFLEELKTTPLKIQMFSVPHEIDGIITSSLTLTVNELP